MFAAKNIAGDLEPHRRISAFTNNLTALLGLLVLGFPVSPATIRTMLAGWILVVVASLQFVLRRVGPQLRLAPIRIDLRTSEQSQPLRVLSEGRIEDLTLRG